MSTPQYGLGPDGPIWLTVEELAERHRETPDAIRQRRHRGEGPLGVRIGRRVLFPLPEVEAFEQRLIEQARREQQRNATGGVVPMPRRTAR